MKTKTQVLLIVLSFASFVSSCKKETTSSTAQSVSLAPGQSCAPGKWFGLSSGISLSIASDFSAQENTAIQNALTEWNTNAPTGVTLFAATGTTPAPGYTALTSYRDSVFGIYKQDTWFNDVSSSALAITQYFGYLKSNNGKAYLELSHADIIFNTDNFSFIHSTSASPNQDFQTVLTHELGHFLGFCHETSINSIMYPYYNGAQRTLKAYDITQLASRYSSPTVAPMTASKIANFHELDINEGEAVRGVIELKKDGECSHFINGKLAYKHRAF